MFLKIIKFSLVSFLLVTSAEAARVIQVKNNKIMIDLEGEEASPQQDLYLLNSQNKRVAFAKISQVKNGKAVANITKGKSNGTETVQLVGGPTLMDDEMGDTSSGRSKNFLKANSKRLSVVVSLMNNSMTSKNADTAGNVEDVPMKGMTFGLTGILDWPVYKRLSFRGTAGYEPFKVDGTGKFQSCKGQTSKDCNADITYLSAGGYARYDFNQSQYLFWGAVGATAKMPMSKTTTALKEADIAMTMTFAGALGLDYFFDSKYFVPVSVEMQMFQKSDTVDASIMMLRGGFGMAF